jgi:hypothetical protein
MLRLSNTTKKRKGGAGEGVKTETENLEKQLG